MLKYCKNTTEIHVEILHHIGLGADARSEEGRSKQIHGPTLPPVAALSEFRKNKYHIIRYTMYTIYIEISLKENEKIKPKYVHKNYMKIIMARWLNDHNGVNLEKN